MSEYYTVTLVNMGFPESAARAAISKAEGRFELALNFVLAGV
jgi:hypothetical protein